MQIIDQPRREPLVIEYLVICELVFQSPRWDISNTFRYFLSLPSLYIRIFLLFSLGSSVTWKEASDLPLPSPARDQIGKFGATSHVLLGKMNV